MQGIKGDKILQFEKTSKVNHTPILERIPERDPVICPIRAEAYPKILIRINRLVDAQLATAKSPHCEEVKGKSEEL